ncbi:hypothetical protein EO95_13930 [Methanosarcina sp. 1.H.T.1A.1]|uniref:glycosyltransferase family 4 protein n=1 Tax=Methanosarcina sp. 1.H.T.1A.1 TaxID=1483602 RepID=UPI000621E0DB|nr:glycosyltransferase family 1 protein [Methanosarcina sp. 1.H.T.1A.1]KKI00370.1 hypothetical protein EO95_13930 [Methanosarcina sp. 1.H.T.1A.1]
MKVCFISNLYLPYISCIRELLTSVSIPDYIHKPKLQNPSRDQQIPPQIMDLFGNRSTSYEQVSTSSVFEEHIEILLYLVNELNLQNDVIFTGYVPDEDLPALYNAADLFVYPSLYEGFGLPPLEAMACGTPVIVSNTSSLPEVLGDAGCLFDPLNPAELANSIYRD